jgi:hypothetical protein
LDAAIIRLVLVEKMVSVYKEVLAHVASVRGLECLRVKQIKPWVLPTLWCQGGSRARCLCN